MSWSGGDSFYPAPPQHDYEQTLHFNHYSQQQQVVPPPPRLPNNNNNIKQVAKYRYGERFAIGVAVSDAYLTHARPIHFLGSSSGSGSEAEDERRFTAEIVPTFRCDGKYERVCCSCAYIS